MCGIVGCVSLTNQTVDKNLVLNMGKKISHRGPDYNEIYIGETFGFGHWRLSIIDLEQGNQPMYDNENGLIIVYNGEIYNYLELRKNLKKEGCIFTTNSDTEVILKAYAKWGEKCVHQFNGMWAFAIFDFKKHKYFFSRDRFGIKPLYYKISDKEFYFASEIKALVNAKSSHYDFQEIFDALVFGPKDGGKTIYKDIYELKAGHNLTIGHNNKVSIYQYFALENSLINEKINFDLYEIDWLLTDSINLRQISDVPLGTLNSGGVDSSIISAITQNSLGGSLNTFSVAPKSNVNEKMIGDESEFAIFLGKSIKSNHSTIYYDEKKFINDIEKAIYYNDSVLIHSNSIPMSFLFNEIKNKHKITVLLSGEGADEVFRGYSINKYINLISKLKYFPFNDSFSNAVLEKLFHSRIPKSILEEFAAPLIIPILRNGSFNYYRIAEILGIKPSITDDRQIIFDKMKQLSELQGAIYYEQKCYLSGLLHRIDRMSMRWGVEVRVPFLDHRLVNYLNSLNWNLKSGIVDKSTKKLLRKIAYKYIPKSIAYRKKYSFASPIDRYRIEIIKKISANSNINVEKLSNQEVFLLYNLILMNVIS